MNKELLAAAAPRAWVDWERAANHIGVRRTLFWELVRSKGLPCRKLTKRCVRFDLAEVDAWMDARRIASVGDARRLADGRQALARSIHQ